MYMKKILSVSLLIIIAFFKTNGQQYFNKNEINVFSFDTSNGKKMTLSLDKTKKCIIYRFRTIANIEFQYPKEIKEDYSKFKLLHYLRGGGIQNEGEDLFQLQFTNEDFTYKIYNNWYAKGNKKEVGILVLNNKTKKQITIKGASETIKGTLAYLADSNIIPLSDDDF